MVGYHDGRGSERNSVARRPHGARMLWQPSTAIVGGASLQCDVRGEGSSDFRAASVKAAKKRLAKVKKEAKKPASSATSVDRQSLALPLRFLKAGKLLSQALDWLAFASSVDFIARFVGFVNEQTKQRNIADKI